MAFYDFKCERCGYISTHQKLPSEISDYKPECNTCKLPLSRLFHAPRVKVAFRPGHDPYTGQNFDSQRARDEYINRNGLKKGE